MNIWPFRKSNILTLRRPRITFLGEQDGPPEKILKNELITIFKKYPDLHQAYLARVYYNKNGSNAVALCLFGNDNTLIVNEVANLFKEQFGKNSFLDIMFISDDQKRELDSVCLSFYSRSEYTN